MYSQSFLIHTESLHATEESPGGVEMPKGSIPETGCYPLMTTLRKTFRLRARSQATLGEWTSSGATGLVSLSAD